MFFRKTAINNYVDQPDQHLINILSIGENHNYLILLYLNGGGGGSRTRVLR